MPEPRWGDAPDSRIKESTILAVDDEPGILTFIERVSRRAGYSSIVTSPHPAEVVGLFRQAQPDIVLLDIHMPGMNGLTLVERLREASPPGVYLPIIIITGDVTAAYRLRSFLGGANDFITKPIDATELMIRMWNQLQTRAFFLDVAAGMQAGGGEQ